MICLVPINTVSPAIPRTATSGAAPNAAGSLAFTGSTMDVVLLSLIAVGLVVGGAALLAWALRRRRRLRPGVSRRAVGGVLFGALLSGLLLPGVVLPTNSAHADGTGCDALQIADVTVNGAPSTNEDLLMLPGGQPVVVHATVSNVTASALELSVKPATTGTAPIAQQITWTVTGTGVSSTDGNLAESTSHQMGVLAAGASTSLTFTVTLPASVGNQFQGQSVPLTLWVQAIQAS